MVSLQMLLCNRSLPTAAWVLNTKYQPHYTYWGRNMMGLLITRGGLYSPSLALSSVFCLMWFCSRSCPDSMEPSLNGAVYNELASEHG